MSKSTDAPLAFDPLAFTLALVGGPLLVTACSFFLIMPVFALVLGGPLYLVVGTPMLLWMVGRYPPKVDWFAAAGCLANVGLMACAAALRMVPSPVSARLDDLAGLALFGLFFGPLWTGTFALLYRRFNRMKRVFPQN